MLLLSLLLILYYNLYVFLMTYELPSFLLHISYRKLYLFHVIKSKQKERKLKEKLKSNSTKTKLVVCLYFCVSSVVHSVHLFLLSVSVSFCPSVFLYVELSFWLFLYQAGCCLSICLSICLVCFQSVSTCPSVCGIVYL